VKYNRSTFDLKN